MAKIKRSCNNCKRLCKSYNDMLRLYYLGRPVNCCPEMFSTDLKINPNGLIKGWETPEKAAKKCQHYTTEDLFGPGQYASGTYPAYIRKTMEDDIEPWDPDYHCHLWFEKGFAAAIKTLESRGIRIEKDCQNCALQSKHYINQLPQCKDGIKCDRYEYDYHRAFDYTYYRNLCDECQIKDSCKKKTDINSEFPTQKCDDWVKPKPKDEEEKN